MKKFLILFSFILTFIFNLDVAYAESQEKLEEKIAYVSNFRKKIHELKPELNDEELDIFNTLSLSMIFHDEVVKNCSEDGILSVSEDTVSPGIINYLQVFMKKEINPQCFMEYYNRFIDNSDECILQRRNNKGPTSICWFDYKRFLPKTSKIKTDNDFLYFYKAYDFFSVSNFCNNTQELTTAERKECKEKFRKFLVQLSNKTAPHCRDIIPGEYKKLLQESKDLLKTVNDTRIENALGHEKQLETMMYRAMYGSAYEKAAIEALQNMGFRNFCIVEGFEEDLKKIQGKNIYKKIESIELN